MGLCATAEREFWAKLWKDAREKSPMNKRRGRTEQEMVESWNKRAQGFAQRTGKGQERQNRVLGMLEQEGVFEPGIQVLDIGAGPGNFAIPLARLAGQVTALEPAAEMVKILEERAKAEQIENIKVIQRTWQEIQIEEEGLSGKFDLVFASMTPGVRDPETLQKMIKASKKFCYMSGFSGRGWGQAHNQLWQQFFNEDLGEKPGDIIHPFNLLYAMGYRPNLRFVTSQRVEEESVEEAIKDLLVFFESYLEITPEVRDTVRKYVEDRSQDGIFRQETNICQGMMVWRVD